MFGDFLWYLDISWIFLDFLGDSWTLNWNSNVFPFFWGGRRIQIGFQAAKPWNASNSCGRMATSHLRSLVDVGRVWLWSSTQCDCPTVGLWVSDGSNSPLGHYGHLDNLDDSKVIIVTDF